MSQLGVPRIPEDLSDDERIELILDLNRRLSLLEELLQGARSRRENAAVGACIVGCCQLPQDLSALF